MSTMLTPLVDGIYRAAYAPDGWGAFLDSLTRALDATTAGFIFYSSDCTAGGVSLYTGASDEAIAEYVQHFASRNEWMRQGGHKLRQGGVHLNEELCPRETMRRSEFYNDWLRRHDVAEALGGCVFVGDGQFTNVTVMRPERLGPFGRDDAALLAALLPHLQCGAEMHRRLAIAEQQARATRDALDALPAPILALSAGLRVVLANRAGAALLRDPQGLRAPGGALEARVPAEQAALRRLAGRAAAIASGANPLDAPGVLRLSRGGFKRPLTALVVPPPAAYAALCDPGDTPAAILLIHDPDAQQAPDALALAQAFDLTPAEAEMACLIAAGSPIDEAASLRGISTGTAKVHLKHIFRKTGAHTQADLAARLRGTPGRA